MGDQWNPGQMGNPADWHPGVDAGDAALAGTPSRTSPYHTTDDSGHPGEGKLDMKTPKQRQDEADAKKKKEEEMMKATKEGQAQHLGGSNF